MRINKYLLLLCLVGLISSMWIDTTTRHFKDENNRTMIYHGVNVVVKLPPYLPITDKFDPFISLSKEDIILMKKFGFNLVRLGVIWESVETSPGFFDRDHLKKVEEIINMLGSNGISVILDAHQDVFSRLFCGEGVPVFYAKDLTVNKQCDSNLIERFFKFVSVCLPLSTFNWEYDENGLPMVENCRHSFMAAHQSPELTSVYQSFYDNENGIIDKFIEFWKVMTLTFKDNKYIIGYDIWNEPWPGSLWATPSNLWPGHASKKQAIPFYKKVDAAIRTIKPDYISLFEPIPFPDTVPLFGGHTFKSFDEMPAGKDKLQYQALNLHAYCCQAGPTICKTGEPLLEYKDFCNSFHERKIQAHTDEAKSHGVPLIITEFGACSSSQACFEEMKSLTEATEKHFVSWAYWMYKPYGDHTTSAYEHSEGMFQDDGTAQAVKEKALTRSYIQAYQGTPISSKFDLETGLYASSFYLDSNVNAATVLYLNTELNYKNGFSVRVFDEKNKNYNATVKQIDNNYIEFVINNELRNNNNGRVVNVAVGRVFNYTENFTNSERTLEVTFEPSEMKTNNLQISSTKSLAFSVTEVSHNHGRVSKVNNEIGDLIVNLSQDLISQVDIHFKIENQDYVISLNNLLYYSVKVSIANKQITPLDLF